MKISFGKTFKIYCTNINKLMEQENITRKLYENHVVQHRRHTKLPVDGRLAYFVDVAMIKNNPELDEFVRSECIKHSIDFEEIATEE